MILYHQKKKDILIFKALLNNHTPTFYFSIYLTHTYNIPFMLIKTAIFEKSTPSLKNCPISTFPEYAFIGRSNVGKSSLINYITGNKKLAKTSSTPGKTQLLNFFLINSTWYLVDLPGFGYAKVAKEKRVKWTAYVSEYLKKRRMLLTTFFLIDSRHSPQKIDLEFMTFMAENNLPFVIVFTKTDKISKQELEDNLSAYKIKLFETWEELMTFKTKLMKKREIIEYRTASSN